MVATNANAIDYFSSATWVVSPTPGQGTDTTITTALTRASSGQTIFIMPGTYTENITLKAGVNLTAFQCDSSLNGTGNVIISGTCTMTTAGTVTISGIQLQTNNALAVDITGSAASIINLKNCYINSLNFTALRQSSSSASSVINLYNCNGNLATTGIKLYGNPGAGNINFFYCVFYNSGLSTTANTCSGSGFVNHFYSSFDNVFSFSSSSTIIFQDCNIYTVGLAVSSIVLSGTSTVFIQFCSIISDAYACLTVGSGCIANIYLSKLYSTATAAITGAGTCNSVGIVYQPGSSFLNNVTTQNAGTIQGIISGNAVNAGFLGEQISAVNNTGIAPATTVSANITSISLTAGIWDISANGNFQFSLLNTAYTLSISTVTNTHSTGYDKSNGSVYPARSGGRNPISLCAYRVTISATTTYYLVGSATYSTGTTSILGCIRAVRVG